MQNKRLAGTECVETSCRRPMLMRNSVLVRERSVLSDPYCHLAWNSVCVCVCVREFKVKYLGNQMS